MPLFDAYLVIDWSSRNKPSPVRPSKDAIWVGEGFNEAGKPDSITARYVTTRKACIDYVRERLLFHIGQNRRVFVGFDFAYGYPAGYASALGLSAALQPWRAIWDKFSHLITDDDHNKNNRFEVGSLLNERCGGLESGPMWGRPQNQTDCPHLTTTAPEFPFRTKAGHTLQNLRHTDKKTKGVQSVWKLSYPGSVGGQSLVGIPQVQCLRDDRDLATFSHVWPFETGFTQTPVPAAGPYILHAEIWPGILPELPKDMPWDNDKNRNLIRDEWQVKGMVEWLAKLDTANQLGGWFDTPAGLSPEETTDCTTQEGWILGSGWKKPMA